MMGTVVFGVISVNLFGCASTTARVQQWGGSKLLETTRV